MTLQLRLTLNAPANCWRSIKSQSTTSRSQFPRLFRLRCQTLVRHTRLRHQEGPETPVSHLSHPRTWFNYSPPPPFDVHPKVLGTFLLCPWKFGCSRKKDIQARFSGAIHIKTLSGKCRAFPSKWKCISVITALFFQYDPSIFTHQFISSLFVVSTLPCLTFPSEGVICGLPRTTIHLNLPMRA